MRNTIKIMIFAVVISVFGANTFAQKTMNEDFRKTSPRRLRRNRLIFRNRLKPFCRMV